MLRAITYVEIKLLRKVSCINYVVCVFFGTRECCGCNLEKLTSKQN